MQLKLLRVLRDRSEVVALVGIVLFVWLGLPLIKGKGVPLGIQALGLVGGMSLALQAIAIVLVYRSNRIINFAQVQVGLVAATFFSVFATYRPHIVRWIPAICPPCFRTTSRTTIWVNYYAVLFLALLLSAFLGWVIYQVVVRRFATAPRLVLTVATLFLAQLLTSIRLWFSRSNLIFTEEQLEQGIRQASLQPSFDWTLNIRPAVLHAPDILTIVLGLAVLAGLVIYFRTSSTGVAIRAAADNPSRVETLGVNVAGVTGRVWIIAGLLSGLAATLAAMSSGVGEPGALNVSTVVRILAAAVIARMFSLPIAVLAAVAFGILDQGVNWVYGSSLILDGGLLFVIGAVLLLQRYQTERADLDKASEWRAAREVRPVPKELRPLDAVKKLIRTGAILLAVIVLGFPWLMSPSQINVAASVLIYAIVLLSVLILTGWAGQITLGQFAFAAVGGYVAAVLHVPILLALFAGGLAGAVVALLIGLPALKMRGLHLAISTLAFALSATALLLNPRYLGKFLPARINTPSFLGLNLDDQRIFYYFALMILALAVIAVRGLRNSRTGRALIAARDNEPASQSFGINLVRGRLVAFAISGFLAAMAGALFAFHQHTIRAASFDPSVSVTIFLVAVIGGLGSVSGPLIGAVYYGFILIFGSQIVSGLASGLVGLVLLYTFPGGLSQMVFEIRDSVLRWIARRNKIVVPSLLADLRVDSLGRVRAAIAPKTRRSGGKVFVPERYRLEDQWSLPASADGDSKGGSGGVAAPRGKDSERQRLRSPRDKKTEVAKRV